jgi:hypothetical protein
MTYLELCQFAHRYIGGGNELPGTAPTTVIGQVGYLFELVKSVADAYRSIQNNRDDWLFMQKQGTFALASGGRVITQAAMVVQVADYGDLRPDLYGAGYRFMQMYANASGVGSNAPVLYLPYQQWRGTIDQQTIPTGRANMVTIQPNRSIEFNYIADQDYTFLCDYKVKIDSWVQTDGVVLDRLMHKPRSSPNASMKLLLGGPSCCGAVVWRTPASTSSPATNTTES